MPPARAESEVTSQQHTTRAHAGALRLAGSSVVCLTIALMFLRLTREAAEATNGSMCFEAGACAAPSMQLHLCAIATTLFGLGAVGLGVNADRHTRAGHGTGLRMTRLLAAAARVGGVIALCQGTIVAFAATFNR